MIFLKKAGIVALGNPEGALGFVRLPASSAMKEK
jgi:hypothetical protein